MTGKILTAVLSLVAAGGLVIATPGVVKAQPAVASASPGMAGALNYADVLVRAWGRGDRPAASRYATASVVDELFGYAAPGGIDWVRVGSEGTAGTIYVTYDDQARGGALTMGVSDVRLSQGESQAVYTARFSQSHPVDAVGYADRLIRAWGRGDRQAAGIYGTDAVVNRLFGYADPGGKDWARTGSQGAAGTIYVSYTNFAGPGTVTVGVNDFAEQDGQRHAVYTVRITS
jgi:hypothetical protein